MIAKLSPYAPYTLATLRVVTAVLFIEAGSLHPFNFPPSVHPPPPPEMETLPFVAGTLELVGGIFILVGLFTRLTAFMLPGMMAVAYWGFHVPINPFPANNLGVAAILYCFIFLYLFFAGSGAWSLDRRLQGKQS